MFVLAPVNFTQFRLIRWSKWGKMRIGQTGKLWGDSLQEVGFNLGLEVELEDKVFQGTVYARTSQISRSRGPIRASSNTCILSRLSPLVSPNLAASKDGELITILGELRL